MNTVFISHATEDQAITKLIADALAAAGVHTWVSFRNIAPGSHWDERIEAALKSSAALVVVVTSSSIESRYVRTEVNEAITTNKTVVPILVEDVAIPLRWKTLQYIRWSSANAENCANQIAAILPDRASEELRAALDNDSDFDNVRRLILTHPEWLPMEAYMSQWYSFRIEPTIAAKSTVDCFAARLDTPGPRAILIYLTSPYEQPFSASGGARPHLRKTLTKIRRHTDFLRRELPAEHLLAPPTLFAAEAHDWKFIAPRYTGFRVYVIAGRRTNYQGAMLNIRNSFVAKSSADLFRDDKHRLCGFEMLSYDRLLEAAILTEAQFSDA